MPSIQKPTQSFSFARFASVLGLMGAMGLVGCNKVADTEEDVSELDGQSAFIASEVDQMGQSLQGLPGTALAKSAVDADTITGELVIERYAYNADCSCFLRKAEFTGSRGYERVRLDSVTLLDSAGQALTTWDRERIAKIVHKRHVTHTKGARQVDVHFNTEAVFKLDNDVVVGVWNGTMTGSFDGEEFKSATVSQVTREYRNGKFRFPISGSVTVVRPLRTYALQFLGEGDAQVTITHRRTGRVTIITVDRDYREKPTP
jgi:hypothetical protein